MRSINNSVEYLRVGYLLPMSATYVAGNRFFDNIIYAQWIQLLLLLLKPWKKKSFENVHNNIYEAAELYEFTFYL